MISSLNFTACPPRQQSSALLAKLRDISPKIKKEEVHLHYSINVLGTGFYKRATLALNVLHLFLYKQSIFDPRPENCLSFSNSPKNCLAII